MGAIWRTPRPRGHRYPIVETLLELRDRGHGVGVRTLACEVRRMRELGFDAEGIAPALKSLEHDDWKARTPIGANKRIMAKFAERAQHEIGDLKEAIAEYDPDFLLIECS
jgi:hypothetical protein